MASKKSFTLTLATGIILGSLVGFSKALYLALSNNYLSYSWSGMLLFSFQQALNQYLLWGILTAFSLWLLFELIYFLIGKQIPVKSAGKFRTPLILCFCLLLYFSGILAFHYYLPAYSQNGKLQPISLLADGGFLLFIFLLGFLLIKIKRELLAKWLKGTAFFLLLGWLLLNLWGGLRAKLNPPSGPNLILIGIDSLRAGHLGCYGYPKATSPNLDRIAGGGIVFSRAFSPSSWTLPVLCSLVTSLYPVSHEVVLPWQRLEDSRITLAELMKNQGYRTAGFFANKLLKAEFGFAQGFEIYSGVEGTQEVGLDPQKESTSHQLTSLALSWLKKNRQKPFLLFLYYNDPHFEYNPPPPYDIFFTTNKSSSTNSQINRDMERYDGEIRWVDCQMGRIFQALKEWELEKNTIIAVFADHGEEFLEHGGKTHGKTLYREVIQVPLILKIPALNQSKYIKTAVSSIDLLPTLLEILVIKNPAPMEGTSLLPLIAGQKIPAPKIIYSELQITSLEKKPGIWKALSLIKEPWHLIYQGGIFSLYNLNRDPKEENNLINLKTNEIETLKKQLLSRPEAKKIEEKNQPVSGKTKKNILRLKSFKYMQ